MAREQSTKKQLTSKQSLALRERIRAVCETHNTASFELCRAAYESYVSVVKVDDKYKFCWNVWGFTAWEDYVAKEMEIHLTTAYALKRVWEVFYVDLDGAWKPTHRLAITKMKLLAAGAPFIKLSRSNVESWLKRAKGMTCGELRAKIFGGVELKAFAVRLTQSQRDQVAKTLDEYRSFLGDETLTRGQILLRITNDWRKQVRPSLSAVAA